MDPRQAPAAYASEAWADVGGVPPRVLASACVEALKSGCGMAPAEWIAAHVPPPLRSWVTEYVTGHVEMRTLAFASRARAHLRVFPTRHPEIWVAENVPAYLQVGVLYELLGG